MKWKGKELVTHGDIGEALCALSSAEEAQAFMAQYREESPHADENVGYLSGYYDIETMRRIQAWCDVEHPIFGRRVPTNEEAFAAGKAMGIGLRVRSGS